MARIIKDPNSTESKLEFTISNVDVAYANGIRRTIIADIPVLAFDTSLKNENKNDCDITVNTSRLNNEMIKPRLSCIPICLDRFKDFEKFVTDCILEINVENNTDEVFIVTTQDFKIKDVKNDKYLSDNLMRTIFPPYIDTIHGREHYIQFVRLRPRISDEIPGEKLSLTCKFSIQTAKNNSSFNVAGTCAYKRTPDKSEILNALQIKEAEFREKGLNDMEIRIEKKNWQLLDGMRIVVPNSFDFIIESIGIYTNEKIVAMACKLIITELKIIASMLQNGEIAIEESNNTKPNCFEIYFENYDYTIGNILNQEMFNLFFNSDEIHTVSVKKLHPHDKHITMEVSIVSDSNPRENLTRMLIKSCESAKNIMTSIRNEFKKIGGQEEFRNEEENEFRDGEEFKEGEEFKGGDYDDEM